MNSAIKIAPVIRLSWDINKLGNSISRGRNSSMKYHSSLSYPGQGVLLGSRSPNQYFDVTQAHYAICASKRTCLYEIYI